MSRSGYVEDLEHWDMWDMIRWRGQVASAIRGKRGQKCLTDLLDALEALPDKRLIENDLENEEGEVCALGALGKARGLNMMGAIDPDEPEQVATAFNIAPQLAQEIAWENDEAYGHETPEHRYERMKAWVARQIKPKVTDAS